MSNKEDIQYHFRIAVKNAAIDISNCILDSPGNRRAYLDQFSTRLDELIEERSQALAELETVKVSRKHLQVVVKWLRDAVIGYKHTDKEATQVLGRKPICFGTWNPDKHCNQYDYHKDGLCPACQAISPLLRSDT